MRVKLGVDRFATVNRSIAARGATMSIGGNEGLGSFRVYASEGNFGDWDRRVFYVAYDFDRDDDLGRLLAVTISYQRAAGAGPSHVFRDRLAFLADKWGASTSKSPGQYQISTPSGVRVTLAEDPKNEVVNESYVLIAGPPSR